MLCNHEQSMEVGTHYQMRSELLNIEEVLQEKISYKIGRSCDKLLNNTY